MKAVEKLHEVSKKLILSGIEAAGKEAELFVRQCLDISSVQLYRDNPELKERQAIAVEEMVSRRSKREPLQYILGYSEFLGLKILVGQGVLIPRPETELMAEHAIKTISNFKSQIKNNAEDSSLSILDLCTGSGCLALALAKEFPDAQVYGSDISEIAVDYAKINARLNKIRNVKFFNGYLFKPLDQNQLFNFIISNPPYVRTNDIINLQPEIKEWEPLNALDGGEDGFNFYREIIPKARKFLKDNGILMLELGAGYSNVVEDMLKGAGYLQIEVIRDYAGVERIIQAKWIK